MRRSAPSRHCYGYLAWPHTHCASWPVQEPLKCACVCARARECGDSARIRSRAGTVLPNSPRKDIWGAALSHAHQHRPSITHTKTMVSRMSQCTQKHLNTHTQTESPSRHTSAKTDTQNANLKFSLTYLTSVVFWLYEMNLKVPYYDDFQVSIFHPRLHRSTFMRSII